MATYTGLDKRIAYLFEHGGGGGGGAGSLSESRIYSTNEQVIGLWTDGKPLYQKTFFSTISATGNQLLADISGLNVDQYYLEAAYIQVSNASIPMGYVQGVANFYAYVRTSDNTIRAVTSTTAYIGEKVVAVLNYTKTTDQGGQSISGILHTYSTDEQIVGTWIDGKPLYEKSYAPIHLTGSQKLEVESFDQTQKYIVSINFVWSPGWNFGLGSQSLYHYWSIQNIGENGYNENTVVTSPQVYVQENKLYFHEKSNQGAGSSLYGIIQYTKATD